MSTASESFASRQNTVQITGLETLNRHWTVPVQQCVCCRALHPGQCVVHRGCSLGGGPMMRVVCCYLWLALQAMSDSPKVQTCREQPLALQGHVHQIGRVRVVSIG